MSWLSGGELHAASWTSSSYPGFGILFENLPATGEQGGSPLLNDGGVAGDEIRWELISTSGDLVVDIFTEGGVYSSTGVGTATYRSYINGVAVEPDFVITAQAESAGVAYSITCETVADSHSVGDVDFYRVYNLPCDTVADNHLAGEVSLIYSESTGIAYSINCETVTDSHAVGDVAFSVSYHLNCNTASDSHHALPVSLIYSGAEVVLIGAYSVNYKKSDVGASYKQTFVEGRYGNG